MSIARISQLDRRTTQSGKANAGLWLLEFERQEPQKADPLTGWNGSGDTNTQVRINFKTREEAIAFAERGAMLEEHTPFLVAQVRLEIAQLVFGRRSEIELDGGRVVHVCFLRVPAQNL